MFRPILSPLTNKRAAKQKHLTHSNRFSTYSLDSINYQGYTLEPKTRSGPMQKRGKNKSCLILIETFTKDQTKKRKQHFGLLIISFVHSILYMFS